MKNVLIILSIGLFTSVFTYAFSQKTSQEQIEADNIKILEEFAREQTLCYREASETGTSIEVSEKLYLCSVRPRPKLYKISTDGDSGSGKINSGTHSTGITVPPPKKGYTKKHSLVLSGSHDYRIYSDRLGASWKNNNPSGLTWGVSHTLKGIWSERGISFEKGTSRPKNEGGNYILFSSVEHGLRAKVIAIRERWGKATVDHFLAGWGTDFVKLSFDKSKIIKDLSEEEFAELFIQQLKKESPGYISQLVEDKVLIIN